MEFFFGFNVLLFSDIHIRNSELLSGTLDKSVIGGGSKKNLFYLILKQYNSEEAIQAMLRLCRVSSFYISEFFLMFFIFKVLI